MENANHFRSRNEIKIYALKKALGPLNNFTNSVQKNFVSAGDVYYHLNNLQIELSKITDQYHFAQDIFSNIFSTCKNTCDSTIALLCFILTKEGRIWWRTQTSNLLIWYRN